MTSLPIRRRARRLLAVLGISTALTAAMTGTAAADAPGGITATYKGKKIDLSEGWAGASICAEIEIGDVRCFEDDAAYNAAMRSLASTKAPNDVPEYSTKDLFDCPSGWACIWDNRNYKKRRLQWNESGTKNLADWDFRDRANSAANRRPQFGFVLIDQRSWQPDREFYVGAGSAYWDLGEHGWNNRADKVRL